MQDFETLCFQNRADWLRLLAAYAQAEEVAAQAEAAAAKLMSKQAAKVNAVGATAAAPLPAISAEVTPGVEPDGEESATGWVSRVSTLDGVEAAELSTLHGRLIALGYLKFKLIDRQVGLRYRLTPAGKQMAQSNPDENRAAAA